LRDVRKTQEKQTNRQTNNHSFEKGEVLRPGMGRREECEVQGYEGHLENRRRRGRTCIQLKFIQCDFGA
jgi:hypothetical protein